MTNPWENSNDDKEEQEEERTQAEEQLITAYETNALSNLPIEKVEEGVEKVDNVELLQEIHMGVPSTEVHEVVEERLRELDGIEDVSLEEESVEESEYNDDNEQSESESMSEESEVEESSIDVSSIAPNAMSPEEAKDKEHIYRTLVWGEPGSGKSHFVYTNKEPLCILDTEGKVDHIAHKFDKEFYIWQPTDYDELIDAMNEALDVLDHYRAEQGEIGTLAVDSMSICWEWAQQKYVDKYQPNKSFEEAKEKFSSNIGQQGKSDWKRIKSLHNSKFREVMIDSSYNIVWTAMSEDDYSAKIDEGIDRKKPVGEKNNVYKVDHIIHINQNASGIPTGSMEKSGLTKYRFTGLEYPTFDKMQEVVSAIEEAELSDENVDVDELTEYDISVMQGNPRFVGDE